MQALVLPLSGRCRVAHLRCIRLSAEGQNQPQRCTNGAIFCAYQQGAISIGIFALALVAVEMKFAEAGFNQRPRHFARHQSGRIKGRDRNRAQSEQSCSNVASALDPLV